MPGKYLLYTAGDYITTPVTGGTKRFHELLDFLLQNGNTVYLLAPGNIDIPERGNCTILPIKTYHSKFLPDGLLNLLFNWRTFKRASRLNVDRTILFSVAYGIQGVLARFRRIVLLLREDLIEYHKTNLPKKTGKFNPRILFYQYIEGLVLKHVEKIIVQSNYDKDKLMERHPNIKDSITRKTTILPNNVNASWMLSSKYLIREAPVYPGKICHLIFSGSFDTKRKGVEILLEAVKLLLKEKFPVHLSLMGDGRLRNDLEMKYKMYDQIVFLGYQENPFTMIARSDLLVVPSLADSFPNTLLEGLFLEIPVIGSNRGGIPEMLQYTELLFEPKPMELKEKIHDIIVNNRFELLRQKCIERKKHFTFDWSSKLVQQIDQ